MLADLLFLQEVFGERVTFNGRFRATERIPNTSNVSIKGEKLRGEYSLSVLTCSSRFTMLLWIECVNE